jgi:hypothetical protein
LQRTLAFQLDSLVAGTGPALVDARLVVLADYTKADAIRARLLFEVETGLPMRERAQHETEKAE